MCDVCAEFERQLRDLEVEIESLIDKRDKALRDGAIKAGLTDRLDTAVRAFTDAKALYDFHRSRKHA